VLNRRLPFCRVVEIEGLLKWDEQRGFAAPEMRGCEAASFSAAGNILDKSSSTSNKDIIHILDPRAINDIAQKDTLIFEESKRRNTNL